MFKSSPEVTPAAGGGHGGLAWNSRPVVVASGSGPGCRGYGGVVVLSCMWIQCKFDDLFIILVRFLQILLKLLSIAGCLHFLFHFKKLNHPKNSNFIYF